MGNKGIADNHITSNNSKSSNSDSTISSMSSNRGHETGVNKGHVDLKDIMETFIPGSTQTVKGKYNYA